MKLLIAFAFFAVALADKVQVVDLPMAASPLLARPDIRQLIVPQHVIDAIKMNVPVMRHAPVDDVPEDLRVRIADSPLDTPVDPDIAENFDEGLELHFVDHASDAEDIAAPEAVKLGEAPLPAFETAELSSPEMSAPEAVRIAEAPLPALETAELPALEMSAPEAVRIAEAPLPALETAELPALEMSAPEAVRIAEAPLPAVETPEAAALKPSVEAVKIAVPHFPGKQYADPRLRRF